MGDVGISIWETSFTDRELHYRHMQAARVLIQRRNNVVSEQRATIKAIVRHLERAAEHGIRGGIRLSP